MIGQTDRQADGQTRVDYDLYSERKLSLNKYYNYPLDSGLLIGTTELDRISGRGKQEADFLKQRAKCEK